MAKEFVERRHGSFYLIGSRVPLAVIVHDFKNGDAPETIQSNFLTLSLEQVYGAIAYYLAHRNDIDRYLESRRQDFDAARQAARDGDPMFYQKLTDAKKNTPLTR